MKNTRKKLLVSSVAALLVSAMALSTATFAWFTTNTTATADGINVKTVKSSKLEISSVDTDWGTVVAYGVSDKSLLPVSTVNCSSWFKADAAESTAFDAKAGTYKSVTDLGSYVVADQLNVRNAGETAINSVKISFSGLENYARLALVETTERGEGVANSGAVTIFDTDGVKYSGLNDANGGVTEITPDATGSFTVGNLAPNDAKFYNLYVWFEGQDEQCFDTNVGQVVKDIDITVTGTPAA